MPEVYTNTPQTVRSWGSRAGQKVYTVQLDLLDT